MSASCSPHDADVWLAPSETPNSVGFLVRLYAIEVFERTVAYPAAYTHLEPSRDPEILVALKWLAERQKEVGGEILVLAPGLKNLGYSAVINEFRGSLRCASEATFKKHSYEWSGGPALALWPTAKLLDLLDDHHGTNAVAAVPWLLKDLETWSRARRPVDLLGVSEQRLEPEIPDPVVRIAMEHLTGSVNLSTGLVHPSDKAHAVETFKILLKGGHRWSPDGLQAWALAHGWDSRGAADLRKYAKGIQDGRRFVTAGYGLKSSVLDHWRKEAASASS